MISWLERFLPRKSCHPCSRGDCELCTRDRCACHEAAEVEYWQALKAALRTVREENEEKEEEAHSRASDRDGPEQGEKGIHDQGPEETR